MPWDNVESTMDNIKTLIYGDLAIIYRNDPEEYRKQCKETFIWLDDMGKV